MALVAEKQQIEIFSAANFVLSEKCLVFKGLNSNIHKHLPAAVFMYSESSLQRTPTGCQNSARYQRGVTYIQVLPKLAYFASKTCFRVLEYNAINAKVCQEAGDERRKSLKTICQRISCFYVRLEATGQRMVGTMCQQEPTNEMDRNTVTMVCTNFHCKEDVVDHVQQKSP